MVYSALGNIANIIWKMIPSQFPFVSIDEFQVMPDHFHGVLIINQNQRLNIKKVKERQGGFAEEKNPMISHNIPRVIRWFKGRCTYECRKIDGSFKWQSTFYDDLLRSDIDLIKVRKYIQNNPKNYRMQISRRKDDFSYIR